MQFDKLDKEMCGPCHIDLCPSSFAWNVFPRDKNTAVPPTWLPTTPHSGNHPLSGLLRHFVPPFSSEMPLNKSLPMTRPLRSRNRPFLGGCVSCLVKAITLRVLKLFLKQFHALNFALFHVITLDLQLVKLGWQDGSARKRHLSPRPWNPHGRRTELTLSCPFTPPANANTLTCMHARTCTTQTHTQLVLSACGPHLCGIGKSVLVVNFPSPWLMTDGDPLAAGSSSYSCGTRHQNVEKY